jgi:hypothetical protein
MKRMRVPGRHRIAAVLALILMPVSAALADLDLARKEPNLEKRSKLALDNAEEALKAAREDYRTGDMGETTKKINEIVESVELANTSLTDTGKNPRKSPRYFKHAEMVTRELSRKLDDFQHQMSYNERSMLEKVKLRVQEVHDQLLTGLMEGRKRKK